MKLFATSAIFVLLFFLETIHAGEIKELILKDGSVITGEVISLSNGIYTIKSDILGVIKLEESKVRTIQEKSSTVNPSASPSSSAATAEEVQTLQQKMMSDKEVMSLIQSLQNDPEFKTLLEDPKIMQAVSANDIATLMADPRFTKLLNNSTVQEIQKKVK